MFYTPLRYPGGKGKLADYVKSIFELNDLNDGHYVEPYAGGAGVALELLMLEHASHIHINDIDSAIHSFWHCVLNDPENFCKKIKDTKVDMKQWSECKSIYEFPEGHSVLDIGFSTFFLNRTNRSGILKAGVIGGKAQAGEWTLDVRYQKDELIQRIQKIAMYSNRISLYNLDAAMLLSVVATTLPRNTLIYLDPPYYVKGKGLYRNFYDHNDHVKIERSLQKIKKQKWIVSYDNVPEIHDIYAGYSKKIYSLSYTAQDKTVGSEVMIYGPGIYYEPERLPFKAKRSKSREVA